MSAMASQSSALTPATARGLTGGRPTCCGTTPVMPWSAASSNACALAPSPLIACAIAVAIAAVSATSGAMEAPRRSAAVAPAPVEAATEP